MFANQTVEFVLPELTDKDRGDLPVVESFRVDRYGSNFIKFDNATRKVVIKPDNNQFYIGKFRVTILLSDNRKSPLVTITYFNIIIKTTKKALVPVYVKNKEDI
jgi:hypothetical protein